MSLLPWTGGFQKGLQEQVLQDLGSEEHYLKEPNINNRFRAAIVSDEIVYRYFFKLGKSREEAIDIVNEWKRKNSNRIMTRPRLADL